MELYLVECKVFRGAFAKTSRDIRHIKNNINRQLEISYSYFKDNFVISPTCIGAYRRFGTDKIEYFAPIVQVRDLLSSVNIDISLDEDF
ncbi:hypothetical protein HY212_04830 [Candidatus Pacearchaeota archaeon]|nr:hypothetical protein [Candidatus Pacearchaeota archaeon]